MTIATMNGCHVCVATHSVRLAALGAEPDLRDAGGVAGGEGEDEPGRRQGRGRQMRQFRGRPQLVYALAAGVSSESWAAETIRWAKGLPSELREGTDKVLVEAAAAGGVAGTPVAAWKPADVGGVR
jgi:hypothetical protein